MTRHTFTAMGCEVVVAGATEARLERIRELFEARDRAFSRFRGDSELSRVNAAAGRPVVVSRPFARTLDTALWAATATDGLVDPTVGAAVVAAGYDRDFDALRDEGPQAGPQCADHNKVELRGRLLLVPRGVALDLNGVVKALAVDEAVALLAGGGFVSAGGDLAARGGVDVALPAGGSVRLVTGGLATSGSTRRRWTRGGEVAHHLVDPRTGRPSTSRWREVSVAGASCLHADVAAKAAFLAGDDGPAWLEERRLPGRFVDGDGAVLENAAWLRLVRAEAVCT